MTELQNRGVKDIPVTQRCGTQTRYPGSAYHPWADCCSCHLLCSDRLAVASKDADDENGRSVLKTKGLRGTGPSARSDFGGQRASGDRTKCQVGLTRTGAVSYDQAMQMLRYDTRRNTALIRSDLALGPDPLDQISHHNPRALPVIGPLGSSKNRPGIPGPGESDGR